METRNTNFFAPDDDFFYPLFFVREFFYHMFLTTPFRLRKDRLLPSRTPVMPGTHPPFPLQRYLTAPPRFFPPQTVSESNMLRLLCLFFSLPPCTKMAAAGTEIGCCPLHVPLLSFASYKSAYGPQFFFYETRGLRRMSTSVRSSSCGPFFFGMAAPHLSVNSSLPRD